MKRFEKWFGSSVLIVSFHLYVDIYSFLHKKNPPKNTSKVDEFKIEFDVQNVEGVKATIATTKGKAEVKYGNNA